MNETRVNAAATWFILLRSKREHVMFVGELCHAAVMIGQGEDGVLDELGRLYGFGNVVHLSKEVLQVLPQLKRHVILHDAMDKIDA